HSLLKKNVAPQTQPALVSAEPASQPVADMPQSAATPAQNIPNRSTQAIPNYTPASTSRPGVAVRVEQAGLIRRPLDMPIQNEESAFDTGIGEGISPGGWIQESSELCNELEPWDRSCGPAFSQPPTPWCYDADPIHPWVVGTCKDDLNKATSAYKRGDYQATIALLKKLAEKDYAPAQSNLAAMYADGIGLPKDYQQALFWWRKAAAGGEPKAIHNMAIAYNDGKGMAKDDQQAVYWYRKAAYYGFADAQYNLGVMYALGTGIAKDNKEAAFWYRKAAERGFANAQYNLGVMYADGTGVAKDDRQATYWYCKAAARGDLNARSNLASMYTYTTKSENEPIDQELSYFCWMVSSVKREPTNRYNGRDLFTKGLTNEQRMHAEAAALILKLP
ncbi:MAG: tetratricopeptide repeat protein, partial [Burkholderiaceae bacterium]